MSKLPVIVAAALILIISASMVGYHPHEVDDDSLLNVNPVKIALTYIQESSDFYSYPSDFDAIVVEKLVEMVEREINTYCEENGIKTRFDFIPYPVEYLRQDAEPGLPEAQLIKSEGINLMIGHDYSVQIAGAYDFTRKNNMLMLSTLGGFFWETTDDHLFTLKAPPTASTEALVELVKTLGYKAFVVVVTDHYRSKDTIDEIANTISFDSEGSWVFYDVNAQDLTGTAKTIAMKLSELVALYGRDHVCVLSEPMLYSSEDAEIFLGALETYPDLSSVKWFDIQGHSEELFQKYLPLTIVAKYGFIQTVDWPSNTIRLEEFLNEYRDAVAEEPTPSRLYLQAARHDAMWLLALSVLDAGSSKTVDVMVTLPKIGGGFEGVLGNCTFDAYGNRLVSDEAFFGWTNVDGIVRYQRVGLYESSSKRVLLNEP
jgi:ABC-type branched-subunit amino acid transport system substrate-binding protein